MLVLVLLKHVGLANYRTNPKSITNFLSLPVLHLHSRRYSGVWLVTRCGSLMKSDYDLHDWNLCLAILIAYGIVFRIIAYFCMVTFQKK